VMWFIFPGNIQRNTIVALASSVTVIL